MNTDLVQHKGKNKKQKMKNFFARIKIVAIFAKTNRPFMSVCSNIFVFPVLNHSALGFLGGGIFK